jgi:hypothetical protein
VAGDYASNAGYRQDIQRGGDHLHTGRVFDKELSRREYAAKGNNGLERRAVTNRVAAASKVAPRAEKQLSHCKKEKCVNVELLKDSRTFTTVRHLGVKNRPVFMKDRG